jgi:uncharacterized membrane protein YoaK (UPF0700 family)
MNELRQPGPVPAVVPPLLSFVAGYVDSCTFLALFGLFVAQVTGSFVVAGAQFAANDPHVLVKVVAIPVFFLAAVATTLVARSAARDGRSALPLALALECVLLVGFLALAYAGFPFSDPNAPLALAASLLGLSAMGVQSALVRLLMRGVASTNVMTTNTTQVAIDITDWVIARRRRARGDAAGAAELAAAHKRCADLLPIVFGFLGGTLAGTLAYLVAGLLCLLVAISIVLGLVIWAMRESRRGAVPQT